MMERRLSMMDATKSTFKNFYLMIILSPDSFIFVDHSFTIPRSIQANSSTSSETLRPVLRLRLRLTSPIILTNNCGRCKGTLWNTRDSNRPLLTRLPREEFPSNSFPSCPSHQFRRPYSPRLSVVREVPGFARISFPVADT